MTSPSGGRGRWDRHVSIYIDFHCSAELAMNSERDAGTENENSVSETKAFFWRAMEARVSCMNKWSESLDNQVNYGPT
jgi:hypothetical protein